MSKKKGKGKKQGKQGFGNASFAPSRAAVTRLSQNSDEWTVVGDDGRGRRRWRRRGISSCDGDDGQKKRANSSQSDAHFVDTRHFWLSGRRSLSFRCVEKENQGGGGLGEETRGGRDGNCGRKKSERDLLQAFFSMRI